VAHSLSAKKRVRQNLKRRARNRARKAELKDQGKTVLAAIAKGDLAGAEKQFRVYSQTVDRVAAKRTIHKNTAARRRSRMARRLNKARSGAGTAAAKA
jgi:small subunit ribosomal protein S20